MQILSGTYHTLRSCCMVCPLSRICTAAQPAENSEPGVQCLQCALSMRTPMQCVLGLLDAWMFLQIWARRWQPTWQRFKPQGSRSWHPQRAAC